MKQPDIKDLRDIPVTVFLEQILGIKLPLYQKLFINLFDLQTKIKKEYFWRGLRHGKS